MTVVRRASRMYSLIVTMVSCIFVLSGLSRADTLKVVTNNALNFRGQQDATRATYFRTVMRAIHPDVVFMEEIASESAMEYMLAQVYAQIDTDWTTAEFMDDGSLNEVCFYRMSKVALVSQRAIHAAPRNINEFVLRPAVGDTSLRIRCMSAHLKASDGSNNAEERRQEADSVRKQTDLFPAGTNFLICGDFNLYTSEEPAYQTLITPGQNPDGQFYDPINSPGAWNNNGSFAHIHTQSTRTASESDGGASGGLDDRFDFILVSGALMDSVGCRVLPSTYHSFGNDGLHFNMNIDDGTNQAVPDSVAHALHHASDHLPVVVSIVMEPDGPSGVTVSPRPREFAMFTCYPNPFNSVLTINIPAISGATNLSVFDVLGRKIAERNIKAGSVSLSPVQMDFSHFGTGTYFVQLKTPAATQVQRVSYVR
jgi:endonuclease/exonuclease/phosphatase family metal-dependent hydrolase